MVASLRMDNRSVAANPPAGWVGLLDMHILQQEGGFIASTLSNLGLREIRCRALDIIIETSFFIPDRS